jgi:hypothetical protein
MNTQPHVHRTPHARATPCAAAVRLQQAAPRLARPSLQLASLHHAQLGSLSQSAGAVRAWLLTSAGSAGALGE